MVVRLRLATLWAFGSEILLWTIPERTEAVDWVTAVIGYLALTALLLDLGSRFRVRGLYGLLALAGLYALGHGLIINPASAFADLPRTLFTRVLGANALVGLGALLILIAVGRLRPRHPVILLGGMFLIGAAWGLWARWSPVAITGRLNEPEAPLTLGMALAIGWLAIVLVLRFPAPSEPPLRLSPFGWTLTLGGLLAAVILRLATDAIPALGFSLSVPLILICLGILYWQRRPKGIPILERAGGAARLRGLLIVALVFAAGACLGLVIPRTDSSVDPLFAITLIFTAYGFVWLPTAAVVIALRGLGRMLRAGHL